LHGVVARSTVAPAAVSPAFRRLTRVRGPLARFSDAADKGALKVIVASGAQYRDFRRVYVEPDGVRTLSAGAIAAIPAPLVARMLGVAEGSAHATLAGQLARRGTVSIVDRLALPLTSWRIPAGTVDLASRSAATMAAQVDEAMPSNFARDSARAESLAPLLVGLANAAIPEVSARANSALGRIAARLPASACQST
jgi:hypothetical protein